MQQVYTIPDKVSWMAEFRGIRTPVRVPLASALRDAIDGVYVDQFEAFLWAVKLATSYNEDKRGKETCMSCRRSFVVLATLMGLCGVAQAEILGGGPVYGGPASVGGQITCRIFNYGLATVTIPLRQIRSNVNTTEPLVSDSCNVALVPANYCAFTANITGNLAYSCRVIANGNDVKLSGVAEVKNASSAILNSLPLVK